MRKSSPILAFLFVLLLSSWVFGQALDIPTLTQRVTDYTGTLSRSEIIALNLRLDSIERVKGSQVAVLIIASTQPESVSEFAYKVASKNKIGRKGVNDGVLLLVAKNDKKLNIQVGYGLEGAIPDLKSKRIIDEYIVPKFKQGDFYGGIDNGISAISAAISGEELPAPVKKKSGDWAGDRFFIVVLAAIFITQFFGGLARKGKGIVGALMGAGIGLLLGGLWFMFIGGIAAFIIMGLMAAGGGTTRSGNWGGTIYGRGNYGGGGGYDSDGFSGGGGDFGGGGSSGDW